MGYSECLYTPQWYICQAGSANGYGVGGPGIPISSIALVDVATPLGYIEAMETPTKKHTNQTMPQAEDDVTVLASAGTAVRRSTSYAADKAKILARLRRIEGQVRGVQRMVEEDQYCLDVLTQLSAVIAGSRATGLLVLEDHIRGCVVGVDAAHQEERLDELTEAIERFTRTVG